MKNFFNPKNRSLGINCLFIAEIKRQATIYYLQFIFNGKEKNNDYNELYGKVSIAIAVSLDRIELYDHYW